MDDEVLGPIADVSAIKRTANNDSASFEMVQFMATAGGLDSYFFNALPSASIFQFSSEAAWHRGKKRNHTGGDESFDVRTVFSQIIEFEDVDGDRKFDKKIDKVLLRCKLNEADFMSFFPDPFSPAFKQENIIFPGTNVSGIKLSTKGKLGEKVWPPSPGGKANHKCRGTVKIDYFLTTAPAFDEKVYLSPTSTKFAFSVDGFKYVKPLPPNSTSNSSTTESLLALKVFVLSQTIQTGWQFSARGSDHGSMPHLVSKSKGKTKQGGFFSWNGTYSGDGRYHEIKTSYAATDSAGDDFDINADQKAAELWFTFSGGQHSKIMWDPTTGYGDIGSAGSSLSDSTIVAIVIGTIALAGILGVAVFYAIQRNKKAGSSSRSTSRLGKLSEEAGYGAI